MDDHFKIMAAICGNEVYAIGKFGLNGQEMQELTGTVYSHCGKK